MFLPIIARPAFTEDESAYQLEQFLRNFMSSLPVHEPTLTKIDVIYQVNPSCFYIVSKKLEPVILAELI